MTTAAAPGMTQRRRSPLRRGRGGCAGPASWLLRSFDPNAAGSLFPPCLFHCSPGCIAPAAA